MTNRIYPHTPTIKAARLKFTLILLALLFIGKYAKAENNKPHIVYVDSKDTVKMQLQVKIAMQEIQIKELMAEKYKIEQSQLPIFLYGFAAGFALTAFAAATILKKEMLRK